MGNLESYLGFAVRSGKIVYGIDRISAGKERKYLMVLCPTAAENLVKKAEAYAARRNLPLIVAERPLEELLHKTNCKLIALTDANMAKAVKENAGR